MRATKLGGSHTEILYFRYRGNTEVHETELSVVIVHTGSAHQCRLYESLIL